jgi:hypothetical protein
VPAEPGVAFLLRDDLVLYYQVVNTSGVDIASLTVGQWFDRHMAEWRLPVSPVVVRTPFHRSETSFITATSLNTRTGE